MTVSLKVFAQIYADIKGWGRLPRLHEDICDWLESTQGVKPSRLLQAYRHAGKSHLVALYVAWSLMCDPNRSFIVLSAGDKLARRNSRFIRDLIEHHPLTHGRDAIVELVSEKDEWQRGSFTVRRPTPSMEPSVMCLSIKANVDGWHGGEIICDDIEIAANCKTEEAREQIREAAMILTSLGNQILAIGTPHHEETVYRWFECEQGFETRKWPVWIDYGLATQCPQAPDLYDPQTKTYQDEAWIARKEKANTTGRFQSQYLLIPAKAYEAQFDANMLHQFAGHVVVDETELDESEFRDAQPVFYIEDGETRTRIKDIRAYWDSASGLRNRDNSVIAIVGKSETNDVYILDIRALPPIDLDNGTRFAPQMEVLLNACRENFCNTVYVETNFSMTLAAELRAYAKTKRAKVRVRETTRTSKQNKIEFIASVIEPLMKVGRLYIHEDAFKEFKYELEEFPNGRRDDRLDAVAGAIAELVPTRVDSSGLDPLSRVSPRMNPAAAVVNTYAP